MFRQQQVRQVCKEKGAVDKHHWAAIFFRECGHFFAGVGMEDAQLCYRGGHSCFKGSCFLGAWMSYDDGFTHMAY